MWDSVVQCQGLEGLQMIMGGVEKWGERLTEVRDLIEKLEEKPKEFKFGPYDNPGSEYPIWRRKFSCSWRVIGNIRSTRKIAKG
jgi:hypothetical protein